MKINKLWIGICVFVLGFSPVYIQGQVITAFSGRTVEVMTWVDNHFKKGKIPPFSFVFGGVHSKDFIRKWEFSVERMVDTEPGMAAFSYRWVDKQTGMQVVCELKAYHEHNAVEWVLRFTNGGMAHTPTLTEVKVIDMDFRYGSMGDITLHYADGTHVSKADFHARKHILTPGQTLHLSPESGRSSDNAFPFFNIESASGQGAMVAIGWSGTWFADFSSNAANSVSLASGMNGLETYLITGESIRTPSICLLFWQGDDRMVGHNRFRRFILEEQTPKIMGQPVRYPVSASFNYGDPHPCNEYTCLTTDYALAIINRYKQFKLTPEVFWLDAGWYAKAADVADNKNWANTVGNWTIDSVRFPDGLKPISDAAHAAGAKFMVWFEPERVIKDSDWGVNLRRWMLDAKGTDAYLFDLGNPEALDWLCQYIGDFMEQNGIDYYRQDFNMRVDNFWEENDDPGRRGIREIRHIEGLYAFWDYLLERFPEGIVDNCASGGRRIDFESMKRSAPLWRTDYHYGEPVGYQTHTYGLNFFLPQTGTGVDKNDRFTFRSSLGTSVVYNWKVTDGASSFTEMQRCQEEFSMVRPYFYEDYYPLTSYDDMTTDSIWLAYQLHRPADHSGVVVAFRRDQSPDSRMEVRLSGLDPGKQYVVRNMDTQTSVTVAGATLQNRFTLEIPEQRESLLLHYEEKVAP